MYSFFYIQVQTHSNSYQGAYVKPPSTDEGENTNFNYNQQRHLWVRI